MSGLNANLKPLQDALAAHEAESFAIGQTWQDMTASRALNTTYTNTTGKPITVAIIGKVSGSADTDFHFIVDGISPSRTRVPPNDHTNGNSFTCVVPNGSTYKYTQSNSGLTQWSELR